MSGGNVPAKGAIRSVPQYVSNWMTLSTSLTRTIRREPDCLSGYLKKEVLIQQVTKRKMKICHDLSSMKAFFLGVKANGVS